MSITLDFQIRDEDEPAVRKLIDVNVGTLSLLRQARTKSMAGWGHNPQYPMSSTQSSHINYLGQQRNLLKLLLVAAADERRKDRDGSAFEKIADGFHHAEALQQMPGPLITHLVTCVNYSTAVGGPNHLTTSAIDCGRLTQTTLKFQRWLNTDIDTYVTATLEISTDGKPGAASGRTALLRSRIAPGRT